MQGDRIEIDSKALGRFLKSEPVLKVLMEKGNAVAAAAGEGFVAKPFFGFDRVSVVVRPDSPEAVAALRRDSTVLTRAIDAARD